MKRLIAVCLLLAATGLMAQPKSDTWDAGQVDQYDPSKSSGLLRGSLLVVNRCCKGEHQFEVSSRSPWIMIHPTDALFALADNAQRFVHPGLDSRNLPPGDHEATISVNCTTCDPGLCDYDVKLRLTVNARQLGSTTGVTQVRIATGGPCSPNGAERPKEGVSKKSCNFRGVYTTKPQITITSCVTGQFSDEASRNALGKMADAIETVLDLNTDLGAGNSLRRRESGVGDVVGLWTQWWEIKDIPTSIPEAVGVAGKKALEKLQGAVDAMGRVVGERGDKCVDLFAQMPVYGASYECAEVERCEQGKWHSLGVTNIPKDLTPLPVAEARSKTLNINMTDPADRAQKFNELNKWVENQRDLPELKQRMKIFESLGPCPACEMPASGGGISIPDDPSSGGRPCHPILQEIKQIEDLIFELQAEMAELQRQLPQIPGRLKALNTRCEEQQRQLLENVRTLTGEVPRAPDLRSMDAAEAKRDAAEKARQDHRNECDRERQRLEREEQNMKDTIRRSEVTIKELNARLLTKRREYEECLRGK